MNGSTFRPLDGDSEVTLEDVPASGATPTTMERKPGTRVTGTCTSTSGDCKYMADSTIFNSSIFSNDCPNAPRDQPDVTVVAVRPEDANYAGQQLGTWGPPPSK